MDLQLQLLEEGSRRPEARPASPQPRSAMVLVPSVRGNGAVGEGFVSEGLGLGFPRWGVRILPRALIGLCSCLLGSRAILRLVGGILRDIL